jgi:hypothetical protein
MNKHQNPNAGIADFFREVGKNPSLFGFEHIEKPGRDYQRASRGYEPTRGQAMQAFARSWRREV